MLRRALYFLTMLAINIPGTSYAGPDDCVFRAVQSHCTASISVKPTGEYTVTSDTTECVAVDVQIDGTVYSQKFRGGSLDDKIMLLQNNGPPTARVNSCTVFETKRQIFQRCSSQVRAQYSEPLKQKAQELYAKCKALPPGSPSQISCGNSANADVLDGYRTESDQINSCIGEPVTEARNLGSRIQIDFRPEYANSYK